MRGRGGWGAIGVAFALALLVAPTASAAIEVGNRCEPQSLQINRSFVSLANAPASPLPAAVPKAGVITAWTTLGHNPGMSVRMMIARRNGNEGALRFTAQSEPGTLVDGASSFATRIPVESGDLLALSGHAPDGEHVTPICNEPQGRVEAIEDPHRVGEPGSEFEFTGFQVPLVVVLEPDADEDGYGDETQ